ncbi:MAG: GNAT family N-acetyltransferase [Armatimonadota bacterium]
MYSHALNTDTELRLLEPRHAEELFDLVDRNRTHLGAWLPWVDQCTDPDDRRTFIQKRLQKLAEESSFSAGIWHQEELAGMVSLNAIHKLASKSASISYFLGEGYQGKGLVTSACRTIMNFAYGTLGLNRLEIYAATGNTRSRAIPARLGFTHEGTRREAQYHRGQYLNLEGYSLLKPEWEAQGRSGAELAFAHPLSPQAELRLLVPWHAERLFALIQANHEHLWHWLPEIINGTYQVEDTQSFVAHCLQQLAEHDVFESSIWYQGEIAGMIGLHAKQGGNIEIGYWLGDAYQGKGLMTMACRALLDHAFGILGKNRVVIRAATGNTPSRAVPERLGFTHESTERQSSKLHDRQVDMAVYVLLREEWEQAKGKSDISQTVCSG